MIVNMMQMLMLTPISFLVKMIVTQMLDTQE